MPSMSSTVQNESRRVRRLIAAYVRLHRQKKYSPIRESALQKRIKVLLEKLDRAVIKLGDSKTEVERVLGPAPGAIGPDSWIYPGADAREFYRIDFSAGAVAGKSFEIILVN
jgi:hypothetical protein